MAGDLIMVEILYGTGVITETSSTLCTLSTTIDGSSKAFPFHKSLLYTFGVRCEGNMTNILENGMIVELCYRFGHPGKKPCIVAVWIGDKPDDLNEAKDLLQPVYDSKGHIIGSVENDNLLVEDKDQHIVLINKDVVFMDGDPLIGVDTLNMQREIVFDAVPLESVHPLGALLQATCAWIGPKPRLLDRFNLGSNNCRISGDTIEGTVAVIPNDVVALVDVALETMLVKVLLFRSSFKQGCTRILDVIDVGDTVYMRLVSKLVIPGRKWWYAVEASKTSDDIKGNVNVSIDLPELLDKNDRDKNDRESISQRVLCKPYVEPSGVLYNIPPLCGVISLLFDRAACITYGDLKVFVHLDDFYICNTKCTIDEFLCYVSPGNNVAYFEAISLPLPSDPEKNICTHEATCAWIGRNDKPTVQVLAATLSNPSPSLLKKAGQTLYGVVSKYLSPFMAFVLVPGYSTCVVIDASNFVTPPQYPSGSEMIFITHHVKLNDRVEFQLKGSQRVSMVLTYDVRRTLEPEENFVRLNRSGKSCTAPIVNVQTRTKPLVEAQKIDVSAPIEPAPITKSFLQSFRKKYPPQGRGFLLNIVGVLNVQIIEEDLVGTVTHKFGTYTVNLWKVELFSKDAPMTTREILKLKKHRVRFDAKFKASSTTNSNFEVVRLWLEKYARPESELLLSCQLVCEESRESFYSKGTIQSIPFHDSAIAIVDNSPVLVPLQSLVTSEQINLNVASIESYFRVGDSIFAKIERRELKGLSKGYYLRAVKCFPGENVSREINSDSQMEMYAPRPRKWVDSWGLGEWYRKGTVSFENGKYLVQFVSKKRPELKLNLDLFEKGQVFIDEKLAHPAMLERYVGEEITFHVAQESGGNGKELFVAFAWIGVEPASSVLLKERLVIPKGVVTSRVYEVVIDSFPLPSHALCYINHAPLLARILTDYDVHCDIIKDIVCDINPLEAGDRLATKAHEVPVGDSVVLMNENKNKKLKSGQDIYSGEVYKNLSGTIVALPSPVGKISVPNSDMLVSFEICLFHKFVRYAGLSNQAWFNYLREKITIGKPVCFSAVKSNVPNAAPFKAFEVSFIEHF